MAKQTKCPSCQASIQLGPEVADGARLRCRTCRTEFRLGESQAASALRGAEQGGQALPREPRRDRARRKRELPIWAIVLGGVAGLAVLALILLVSVVDTSPLKPESIKPEADSEPERTGGQGDETGRPSSQAGTAANQAGDKKPDQPPEPKPDDESSPSEASFQAQAIPETGSWVQYPPAERLGQDMPATAVHQDTPGLDLEAEDFDDFMDKGKTRSLLEIKARSVTDLDWTLRSCVDGASGVNLSDWTSESLGLAMDWPAVTSLVLDSDAPWAALSYRAQNRAEGWLETRSLRDGSVAKRMVLPAGWTVAQVEGPDRILLLDAVGRSPLLRWSLGNNGAVGEKISIYPDGYEGPRAQWARIALGGDALVLHRDRDLRVHRLSGAGRGWVMKDVREAPCVAPGGQLLGVVADRAVWLLEIETGRVVRQLARNLSGPTWSPGRLGGLFFSPGGKRLGWIRPDGELWTWDFMTGRDTVAKVWQGRRETPPAAAISDDGWVMIDDQLIDPEEGRTVWLYETRGLLNPASGQGSLWVHGPDGRFWYFADRRDLRQAVLCAAHLPLLDERAILSVWREEPTSVTPGASLAVKVQSPLASADLAERARRALDRAGLRESADARVDLRVEVRALGSGEPVDYLHEDNSVTGKVHALRWVIRVRMVRDGRTLWAQPWKLVADETRLRSMRIPSGADVRGYLDDRAQEKLLGAMRGLSLPALVTGRGQGASGRTRLRLHTTPPVGERRGDH